MQTVYSKAEELRNEHVPAAVCIVVETTGSTPRKKGSKMIVYADGRIYGSIGGGSVEKEVCERALGIIASGMPEKCTFQLEEDLSKQCGGSMEIYIEPIHPSDNLFIFGAGHIGKAVVRFAREFSFTVTVIDPRDGIFDDPLFAACQCINRDYFDAIDHLTFDSGSFLVVVTPKHAYDEEILAKVALKPHAYLGMIGSRKKVSDIREKFIREKILTKEVLDSIDMPIGIPFNAQTPDEIAISILAKLIDVRNTMVNNNS
jgi:xanthine dehydrogenase accessory factor